MKDHELENRILAARPHNNDVQLSPFTLSVVQELKNDATFSPNLRTTSVSKWSSLMQYIKHHKVTAGLVGASVLSALSFSGYAYATGTNPIALVTRIIQGDKVQVQYQGRKFEYGAKRSYSDAAVTAYAELNTVWDLHFKASNAFTVPRDGIEHVENPYNSEYLYPWVGTVDSVDANYVYVTKQYTLGDKVKQSVANNQKVQISRKNLSYYVKGEIAAPASMNVGKIIEVFQDDFLSHQTGSKNPPTPIDQFFGFELSHTLADIMEADQSNQAPPQSRSTATDDQAIFEPSWGGISNVCLNNGADTCDQSILAGEGGQSLFIQELGPGNSQIGHNPNVIPFGEMVADPSAQSPGLIIRNTEGRVINLTPNELIIKTSSDAEWKLALEPGQLDKFASTWHTPLKVGNRIGASIVGSVNDLDNRTIDNMHIYEMKRY